MGATESDRLAVAREPAVKMELDDPRVGDHDREAEREGVERGRLCSRWVVARHVARTAHALDRLDKRLGSVESCPPVHRFFASGGLGTSTLKVPPRVRARPDVRFGPQETAANSQKRQLALGIAATRSPSTSTDGMDPARHRSLDPQTELPTAGRSRIHNATMKLRQAGGVASGAFAASMNEDRIGKYRVIGKLGQGGMARVLLTMVAGPHGFNKLLVVKELREELCHDPEFLAMFLDEARLAARLNHPNVVQTYEVGREGERYFIAMEYLEGQPLHAVLRRVGRPNMPLDLHVRILADVLAGLEYAHTLADFDGSPLRVVHRDVSPQNVFVTYDGQVKLVDFGIAKAAGASSSTREGVFKGKLSYVAPEQARGAPVDHRADLFAVGVMLWEAMAGRRLVQGDGEASLLARRIAGHDPKILDVVLDAPADLAAICDRSMALDPTQRFETAREFQEVLEDYLDRSAYRVGPKEVGSVVAATFREERAKIRAQVEEQVRRQREGNDMPLPLIDITASGPVSSMEPTPASISQLHSTSSHPNGTLAASQVSRSLPLEASPKSASRAPWIIGGALLLSTAAAIGAIAANKKIDATGTSSQKPQPASELMPAPKPPLPAEQVAVTIRYPDTARAKLDGGTVTGNPFVAKVARDANMHHVSIEEEGYKTEDRTVTFDKDVDLSINLTPLSTAKPAAGGRPRPVLVAKGAPSATKPSADPSTVDEDGPRRAPPKPKFEIDEQDPYKKK